MVDYTKLQKNLINKSHVFNIMMKYHFNFDISSDESGGLFGGIYRIYRFIRTNDFSTA
jgi:hypothetical protein